MWKGANFKLKITKVAGYQNYDKSEFDSQSVLGNLNDDELGAIWKQEHSRAELVADKEFKSYDDLKVRLEKVLGGDAPAKTTVEQAKAAPKKPQGEDLPWEPEVESSSDDDMAYFKSLAEE